MSAPGDQVRPTGGRLSGAGWLSGALLASAVLAAAAVFATWIRAQGFPVPASPDVASSAVTHAGTASDISVAGVGGMCGAVALAAACLLAVIALWSASPAYRRARAGYAAIAVAAPGIAAVVWFVCDDAAQRALLGADVDVRTDSMERTAWPWITLCCFVIACVIGVLLVPRGGRSDADQPGDAQAVGPLSRTSATDRIAARNSASQSSSC